MDTYLMKFASSFVEKNTVTIFTFVLFDSQVYSPNMQSQVTICRGRIVTKLTCLVLDFVMHTFGMCRQMFLCPKT